MAPRKKIPKKQVNHNREQNKILENIRNQNYRRTDKRRNKKRNPQNQGNINETATDNVSERKPRMPPEVSLLNPTLIQAGLFLLAIMVAPITCWESPDTWAIATADSTKK